MTVMARHLMACSAVLSAATLASGQLGCTNLHRESEFTHTVGHASMAFSGTQIEITSANWASNWAAAAKGVRYAPGCGALPYCHDSWTESESYQWGGAIPSTGGTHTEHAPAGAANVTGKVFGGRGTSSGSLRADLSVLEKAESTKPFVCFGTGSPTHWIAGNACADHRDEVTFAISATGPSPSMTVGAKFKTVSTLNGATTYMDSYRSEGTLANVLGGCMDISEVQMLSGGTQLVLFVRAEVLTNSATGSSQDVKQGLLVGRHGEVLALGMFAGATGSHHQNSSEDLFCLGTPSGTAHEGVYGITTDDKTVPPNFTMALSGDTSSVTLKTRLAILCNNLDVNRDDAEDILDRNMIMSLQGVEIGDDISGYDPLYNPYADQNSDGVIDGEDVNIFDAAVCAADLDGDGYVTSFDYQMFQGYYAASDPRADVDGSGAIDFFDLLAYDNLFSAGCP